MLNFIYRLILLSTLLLPPIVAAASNYNRYAGAGQVANNMMEPVSMLANFIGSMSVVLGISFVFAAFIKYMEHRVNPLATPISTIVLLFIMGIILVFLPLIYKLTDGGVPFTLF